MTMSARCAPIATIVRLVKAKPEVAETVVRRVEAGEKVTPRVATQITGNAPPPTLPTITITDDAPAAAGRRDRRVGLDAPRHERGASDDGAQ
jgi:hypothetical protein